MLNGLPSREDNSRPFVRSRTQKPKQGGMPPLSLFSRQLRLRGARGSPMFFLLRLRSLSVGRSSSIIHANRARASKVASLRGGGGEEEERRRLHYMSIHRVRVRPLPAYFDAGDLLIRVLGRGDVVGAGRGGTALTNTSWTGLLGRVNLMLPNWEYPTHSVENDEILKSNAVLSWDKAQFLDELQPCCLTVHDFCSFSPLSCNANTACKSCGAPPPLPAEA